MLLAGLIAGAALLGSALPAQASPSRAAAVTGTLSGVQYVNGPGGPADGDDFDAVALTPDGTTAVVISDDVYITDVATNTSTKITSTSGYGEVLMDATGTYAYAIQGTYGQPYSVSKINVSNKSIVSTWSAGSNTYTFWGMHWSVDHSTILLDGSTGTYPNYDISVSKLKISDGTITQFSAGQSGVFSGDGAVLEASGELWLPTRDAGSNTGLPFTVFNPATNTFRTVAWAGPGYVYACDALSSSLVCIGNDGAPWIATIDSSGAVVTTARLSGITDLGSVDLSPDGSQAYVFGNGTGSTAAIEELTVPSLTSVEVFPTVLSDAGYVAFAPQAHKIWFTADYIKNYGGGYQVLTYSSSGGATTPTPALAATGFDSSTLSMAGGGILAAGLALVLVSFVRRRAVKVNR